MNMEFLALDWIRAHLSSLDVSGVDAYDHINLVLQRLEDTHLHAGFEAGKHTGGVVVEKQLAAALDIEFPVTVLNPLKDVTGLLPEVFVIVKTDSAHSQLLITDKGPERTLCLSRLPR